MRKESGKQGWAAAGTQGWAAAGKQGWTAAGTQCRARDGPAQLRQVATLQLLYAFERWVELAGGDVAVCLAEETKGCAHDGSGVGWVAVDRAGGGLQWTGALE